MCHLLNILVLIALLENKIKREIKKIILEINVYISFKLSKHDLIFTFFVLNHFYEICLRFKTLMFKIKYFRSSKNS